MSRRAVAALAVAAVGVIGVAGSAAAVTGTASGFGNGYDEATGVHTPELDGSGGWRGGGWSRTDGSQGRGIGGQGMGGQGMGGRGVGGQGVGGWGSDVATHESDIPPAVPGAEISEEVAKMLAFMVQEEKLARDVYALAIDEHGDRVFVNINRSESNHMDEVRLLLDRYGVADPTMTLDAGMFDDEGLEDMYADLAADVESGREEAIQAAIDVEEADIADLRDALKLDAPEDVTAILENLLAGSERHLAAFQRNA